MALLERTSRQEILTTYQFSRVADATPVERFRTLFYLLIGHGRRHGWRWSPTQANHKRLLDTEARQPAKQGNSKAFCKCMLSLVESLSAEFDLGQASSPQDTKNAVLTVEYGDRQGAWMAKPSTCGIDAAYRGNMGWEHAYPGKTSYDWMMEYRAHRQHSAFNAAPVHLAVWECDPIAAWDDSIALVSVEWPPGDEERLNKALTLANGDCGYERLEAEQASANLPLIYTFMRFRSGEVVRPARVKASGWYLWQVVDLDQVIAREAQEEAARAKAAKRKAQLERIHGKGKAKKK